VIEPTRLEYILATVEQQAILGGIRLLREGTNQVPPAAFGVAEEPQGSGDPSLVMIPVLDLQQRFTSLRQAVQRSHAQGFVFMFDGHIKGADGLHDALLVVTCTPTSRRAQAVYYRRTVEGLQVGDGVEAPDEIAAPYQQKVWDVQPQSRPA
jgi:hypothetical protein